MTKSMLLLGTALLAWGGPSQATVMATADLFTPSSASGTVTAIDVSRAAIGSQAPITGPGYTVTFAVPDSAQGVAHGNLGGRYALPVAGTSNDQPTYLTGGYGSAQTTSVDQSGNYLSTGTGSITISFSNMQKSLALLWGSVDAYNSVSFLDANGNVEDTLTGSMVQSLASGLIANGYQGPRGSAYITATDDLGFTAVRFSSSLPSFEFAGVAATTGIFNVPEPVSVALFASGLGLAGLVGRRRRTPA